MAEVKSKTDIIQFTFVSFYCRSYPLPSGMGIVSPIRFNCLSYFVDCFDIIKEIDAITSNNSKEKRDYKLTRLIMMNQVPAAKWTDWPDKYGSQDAPMSTAIISKYTKKDVNKFLDRLINGLTPSKIYRMKGRDFRVTAGIYTELGMTVEHPLHRIIVMRQMMETGILFDSLWHLTYNFLLDTENLGNV